MEPIRFLIYALAVFRMSHLIVWEDGPFDCLERLRAHLGVRYDAESDKIAGEGLLGGLIACQYCLSVWFALGFWLLSFTGTIGDAIALVLALSGVTVLIGERR